MKKRFVILLVVLCAVLIAASVLVTSGHASKIAPAAGDLKTFRFVVTDGGGREESFQISTEKKTVGEALLEEGLISGDSGPYGLYVKEVNGIPADYEVNGTYWAFYINGEVAMSGVDMTDVEDGAEYAFRVEK